MYFREKKCGGNDVVKCDSAGTEWAYFAFSDSGCADRACTDYVASQSVWP